MTARAPLARVAPLLLLAAACSAPQTPPAPSAATVEPAAPDLAALRAACRAAPAELEPCQAYLRAAVREGGGELAAELDELARRNPELWAPRYLIGEHRFHRGRFAEAESGYREAQAIAARHGDARGVAASKYGLATMLLRAEETARAETLLAEVLDEARRLGDRTLLTRALYQLARRHRAHGRYFDEEAALRELLEHVDADTNDQLRRVAGYALGECARRLGRHAEAALRFEEALSLSAAAGDRSMEAAAAMARGMVLVDLGEPGALELFRRAAAAAAAGAREDWRVHAEILAGVALLRAGRVAEAAAHLRSQLDASRRSKQLRSRNLLYLAEAERQLGRLAEAEPLYREAVSLAAAAELREELRDARMGLAALHRARGELAAAVEWARRAEDLVESSRANISTLEERTHFLHTRSNTYRILAASLAALEPADLAEPFAAVERAHSRTLRESLASREDAAAATRPLDLAAVQSRLEPGDLLVEFLLGEDESTLVTVDRRHAALHALPAGAELERAALAYLEVLLRPLTSVDARLDPQADLARFAAAGHELFRRLLGPVAERLAETKRLIVVPDRRLYLLPFEALLVAPPAAGAVPEFLGTRLAVVYLPAAALLEPRAAAPPRRVIVVTADGGDAELDLPPLRHAAAEAEAIRQAHGATRTLVLSGGSATLERLVEACRAPADVLHLTAHAMLDPARGPRVVLAGPRGAPRALDAASLPRLGAVPPLVVLSACASARGELVGGEGLVGLVRAFTLAGSTQVVASLWQVDDARTAALMSRVHAALARGVPPSAALLEARRAAAGPPFAHPFFWAGFVLYGADAAGQERATMPRASSARLPPSSANRRSAAQASARRPARSRAAASR